MGFVEHMRWWHWTILSLVLGAALGYLNANGGDAPPSHRSIDTMKFEQLLLKPPIRGKDGEMPWISQIVVYPPRPSGKNDNSEVQLVTFVAIMQDIVTGQVTAQDCYMLAPCPYEPKPLGAASPAERYPGTTLYSAKRGDTIQSVLTKEYNKYTREEFAALVAANNSMRQAESASDREIKRGNIYFIPWNPADHHTINDFLDAAVKLKYQNISYHYIWWQSPKYAMRIWMTGTFILVGVIWPILLRMMLLGGLGREEPDDYDLSRFKGSGKPATVQKQSAALTTDDLARIGEMEASFKASLGSMADAVTTSTAAATASGAPAAAPEIKKLIGGSDVAQEVAKTEEEAQRAYRGEFYPVVKETVKPAETHEDAPPETAEKPPETPAKPPPKPAPKITVKPTIIPTKKPPNPKP
jgi:hypothetical protein